MRDPHHACELRGFTSRSEPQVHLPWLNRMAEISMCCNLKRP